MRDLLLIVSRLHWLWPPSMRRYPGTPRPWARCHCGALAEYRSIGVDWCWPCKYAWHETCECSEPANRGGA